METYISSWIFNCVFITMNVIWLTFEKLFFYSSFQMNPKIPFKVLSAIRFIEFFRNRMNKLRVGSCGREPKIQKITINVGANWIDITCHFDNVLAWVYETKLRDTKLVNNPSEQHFVAFLLSLFFFFSIISH